VIETVEQNGELIFGVRVAPRASRDAIDGEYAGALKVRVTAPRLEDRANQAVRRLLAERLNVPVSAVRIVAGDKDRNKRVATKGVSRAYFLNLISEQRKAKE
jgi:uncharacterized protein (TIGR00251 family)